LILGQAVCLFPHCCLSLLLLMRLLRVALLFHLQEAWAYLRPGPQHLHLHLPMLMDMFKFSLF